MFGDTRPQRCWMHKTANVLNYLPKSVQGKVQADLHQIGMAETKTDAEKAFALLINKYQAQYPQATDCLEKDREVLLTFYDFPAEHWKHLRTTNPVKSTHEYRQVANQQDQELRCGSRVTVLSMVLQLFLSAEKRWRKLNGVPRLAEVVEGVKFVDGIRQKEDAA
ncbi:MAG TPA: transposase [Atribacteraceae bacterium]|nr:transposase [Atribacteraceae bacterium]